MSKVVFINSYIQIASFLIKIKKIDKYTSLCIFLQS